MDFEVTFNLTKEELLGALKTIYLFLDGLSFKNTCDVFREECVTKGFDKFSIAPKNVILYSQVKNNQFDKQTQTIACDDIDGKSFQLESSVHSEPETKEGLVLYYKEPFKTYTISSKEVLLNVEKSPRNSDVSTTQEVVRLSNINFAKRCSEEIVKRSDGTFSKSYSDPTLNSSNFSDESVKRDELKTKLRSLEKDYKKLMSKRSARSVRLKRNAISDVTTELTAALQTHVMGQSENLNAMLNKCKCIYPELFRKVGDDVIIASNEEIATTITVCDKSDKNAERQKISLEKCGPQQTENLVAVEDFSLESAILSMASDGDAKIADGIENSDQKESIVFYCNTVLDPKCSEMQYFELNYQKLKEDLVTGDCDSRLALVVALKLNITKSSKDLRNVIINSYTKNDILDILSSTEKKQSIVEKLFKSNCNLEEDTSRLVNTIASLNLGREYLCSSTYFLTSFLVPVLKGTFEPKIKLNSVTEEMLIATVQKLSLKCHQRQCMINAEMTEYAVGFLSANYLTLSRYCLEYATALLMNLCLHETARERLRPLASDTITLLANLLNGKFEFCLPYVNGTIYSLLSDEYINQEARRQHLFDLIRCHICQTNGEVRSELQHIIKVHLENSDKEACKCDSTVEPKFEADILEPELSGNDDSINKEDVLKKYRRSSVQIITNVKCLSRPTTPLERSVTNVSAKIGNEKKQKPTMSYCEETMQFYYAPTKNAIFNPRTERVWTNEPKRTYRSKKETGSSCGCYYNVGKTTPYPTNKSLLNNIPIAYNVPICYRDNYEHFKIHYNTNENRYACNCYQLLSEDVENTSNNNKTNNVGHRYHYCPQCKNNHRLDESNIRMCNQNENEDDSNFANCGVVNFSFQELSDATDGQLPLDAEGSCYDVVFQSRPKILRTPP